ncbi:MAG: enoyl-CoA hydratase/isomerase family protein, partial [Chloroflexi bacterium]|nr:enoyl-CoA hydratase/isomerase family protein [Chloroflexota bacterium]
MELEHVLYDVDGPVATITLNRPDRLNALTGQTMEEIGEALERAHVDGAIKVIVLTGAGRGFCSGGDRKATHARRGQGDDPADRPRMKRPFYKAQLLFTTLEKPVLAAINGPAMGGGLDLALWCDIRIASDRATMGEVYINRGLVPDMGGIYLLTRIVGYAKSAQL